MPDLILHPVPTWIPGPAPDPDPGFAGMTILGYLIAGAKTNKEISHGEC
jgi:hypothetical protein